jgi:hypothetical protein
MPLRRGPMGSARLRRAAGRLQCVALVQELQVIGALKAGNGQGCPCALAFAKRLGQGHIVWYVGPHRGGRGGSGHGLPAARRRRAEPIGPRRRGMTRQDLHL